MEAAIGFEPMNGGFADLSLNHLGTPPLFPNYQFTGLRAGTPEYYSENVHSQAAPPTPYGDRYSA
jgi:hypothetical protein